MVERIMLFKLVDASSRDEVAALTLKSLAGLRLLEELSVGLPADEPSAKSWDLSVVMGFASSGRAPTRRSTAPPSTTT